MAPDASKECTVCKVHDERISRNKEDIEMIQEEMKRHNWWATTLTFVGVIFTGAMSTAGVIVGFYGKAQGWW